MTPNHPVLNMHNS